ncbi:30S ribosomal protein S3ae [Candidatus Bathyarchaeota archaeon]|nr:MAG: 30S ribosomal protein S3ae [Candidatus Bathyarchaeota archaeon]
MSRRTRVRDKWKLKQWYSVYSPPYFGGQEIALIPADEPSKLLGRVVEVTLYDLTKQDIQHMNIKLYFKIVKVEGLKAETIFKGHEYAREYLRSLVRRWSSRVDASINLTTKDGYKVRVFPVAFTRKRVKPSQESAIRKIMTEVVLEKGEQLTFEQLAQECVLGKLASDIFHRATKICPLRHVGIRKTKLLAVPEAAPTPQPPAQVEVAAET